MIITPLMSHQGNAVDYILKHNPCALFLPPGSGKSLISLAVVDKMKAKRILITSDKSNAMNTWAGEIARHTDWDVDRVLIRPTAEDMTGDHNKAERLVVVTNYDYIHHLKGCPFDMWIGDESACIKDQRTDRHKLMRCLLVECKLRLILNGTPMTERLEDLWGQYRLLDDGLALGPSLTRFRYTYMQPDPYAGKFGAWIPKRSAYTSVMKDVAHMTWWPQDLNIKMPKSTYTLVSVPMSKEQIQHDMKLRDEMNMVVNTKNMDLNHAVVVLGKRLQLCGGVLRGPDDYEFVQTQKISVLRKLLDRNKTKRVVVWHMYIPETDLLRRSLAKYNPVVYASPQDVDALNLFKVGTSKVLLARLSMCRGLNQLADTDMSVFYSLPYSYNTRAQAEGRARRISSTTNTTHYVDMVTKGGVDEIVRNMLCNKRSMSLTVAAISEIVRTEREGK